MAELIWDNISERFYETGLDRGVLYVGENAGVVWNGLVSVTQSPSGGEPTAHYIDGVKFINYSSPEEAAFTLSALYSPAEFDVCEGESQIRPGFTAHNQPRAEFGLSYRTKIGNDVEGLEYGHKIHLIYNCLASPSEIMYETLSDDSSIDPLSWSISTRPVVVDNFAISAHFEFDSTKISENNMAFFENTLYGSDLTAPRMPSLEEIFDIYTKTYGVAQYGITTYP